MDIKKSIEIVFTPEEVEDILKKHIGQKINQEGYSIKNIVFQIDTVYTDHNDQYGTKQLTRVICQGEKSNDLCIHCKSGNMLNCENMNICRDCNCITSK